MRKRPHYAQDRHPTQYARGAAGISGLLHELEITEDVTPAALARLVEMHARYYARAWGFGAFFEAKVAREAGEFVGALPHADSRLWFARAQDSVIGSIAIDGRQAAREGAHLRWFILDDSSRGAGLGGRLLDTALSFRRAQSFPRVYLWTFAGLDAARRLYESRGFRLVEERNAESWGVQVREQRIVLELRA